MKTWGKRRCWNKHARGRSTPSLLRTNATEEKALGPCQSMCDLPSRNQHPDTHPPVSIQRLVLLLLCKVITQSPALFPFDKLGHYILSCNFGSSLYSPLIYRHDVLLCRIIYLQAEARLRPVFEPAISYLPANYLQTYLLRTSMEALTFLLLYFRRLHEWRLICTL